MSAALADWLRPRLRLVVPWSEEIAVTASLQGSGPTVDLAWSNSFEAGDLRWFVRWGDGLGDELGQGRQTVTHSFAPGTWHPSLHYVSQAVRAVHPLPAVSA